MKNLRVLQRIKAQFAGNIVSLCNDADNKRIFVILSDLSIYDIGKNQKNFLQEHLQKIEHDLNLAKVIGRNQIKCDDVILTEYIVESGHIVVVLKYGFVFRISSMIKESGFIYTHDVAISSVKLSPSQDLMALADVNNNIIIFSSDMTERLYQENALSQNDSINKPVGVGWGSKETQFFGLDGRPSKEKEGKNKIILTEDEISITDKIESSDIFKQFRQTKERATVIDWRGDGQMLASLTYIPEVDKHYLKVWNRNLELQYMSEQLVTMERGIMCWIPNGQYACCAQRRDGRVNEIALFEKNGMVHQRVTLPTILVDFYIKEMTWSCDSSILTIIGVQFKVDNDDSISSRYILLLYTMQNFHYYLKFATYLGVASTNNHDIYSSRWDPINHSMLYVWSSTGQCLEFSCASVVDYSLEGSLVAIQDANKIKMTPFEICNIPPPMCAFQIEFDQIISKVIVNRVLDNSVCIITIDNHIYIPDNDGIDSNIQLAITNPKLQHITSSYKNFRKLKFQDAQNVQNLIMLSRYSFAASRQFNNLNELILIEKSSDDSSLYVKSVLKSTGIKQIVSIVCSPHSQDKIFYVTEDFVCNEVSLKTGAVEEVFNLGLFETEFLHLLDSQFLEPFSGLDHDKEETTSDCKLITLDHSLTLRCNENLILSNSCTSFRITNNFLIYTTVDTLNIVPFKNVYKKQGHEPMESWVQPIENGGTLGIVSEKDSKVVLQMPRGNLEILHPRILVLREIIVQLIEESYAQALHLARRHRVDLNFICDYLKRMDDDSSTKLSNFIEQIAKKDSSLLNLFITELNSEDTILNRYKELMDLIDSKLKLNKISNDKVNNVCTLSVWNTIDLQPKLLSLLKQRPRKAGKALEIISELNREAREEALRFMLYFVDIDQLFNDALSTYDTGLALMVAGVSTKDPKEYLALLDKFNGIAEHKLRKYEIDMHIKDYEKAFLNLLDYFQTLSQNDSIPMKDTIEVLRKDILGLIVSKRIYKFAARHICKLWVGADIAKRSNEFRIICVEILSKYGDYLLEKRYYLEACLVYLKARDFNTDIFDQINDKLVNKALDCLMLENDWEKSLAIIKRYYALSNNSIDLRKKLSENLILQGKLAEAALVVNTIGNNYLAKKMIEKGKWYLAESFHDYEDQSFESEFGTMGNQSEFYNIIKLALNEEVTNFISSIEEDMKNTKDHFCRYKELVAQGQRVRPTYGTLDHDNCALADTLSTVDGSEVSSMISDSKLGGQAKVARSGAPSIRTRASSSKSSRSNAERRKKIKIKKDSRFEDMALVLEIKNFVNKQESTQKQARQLAAALVYFEQSLANNSIGTLNNLVNESYEFAKEVCKNLWPRGFDAQEESVNSVYKRFIKRLELEEMFENVDFQVLVAPELPNVIVSLEL